MYKKNSLIFALGTKVIAVFSVVHSIACFHDEQNKRQQKKAVGMLYLCFLYLLLCVSFVDGCGAGMELGVTDVVSFPGSRVCWSVGAEAEFVGAVVISQAR